MFGGAKNTIKDRIAQLIDAVCEEFPQEAQPEKLQDFYKEFINGFTSTHVPLRFLPLISSRLPGGPLLVQGIPSKGEPAFRDRKTGETILGVDPNGKILVKTMIDTIVALAKQKGASTQASTS